VGGYDHDVHDVHDAIVIHVVGAAIALVSASAAPFTGCLHDVGDADRTAAHQSDEAQQEDKRKETKELSHETTSHHKASQKPGF